MGNEYTQLKQLIEARNTMLVKEKELYIAAIEKINMNTRELLKNDFGTTLVKNTARDLAGEVARRFFDLGDYYITVDQLYNRFIHFSYDNDVDLLSGNEGILKTVYNYSDIRTSSTIKEIAKSCQKAQEKLFEKEKYINKNGKEKTRYKDNKMIEAGKSTYLKSRRKEDGVIVDELTNKDGGTYIRKDGVEVRYQEVDHIQALSTATYNKRYIKEDKVEQLKKFYNSDDNFQMIDKLANTSKGDVKVFSDGRNVLSETSLNQKIKENNDKVYNKALAEGKSKKEARLSAEKSEQNLRDQYADITYKATPEEYAQAICDRWESIGNKEELMKKGYLDQNGKVKSEVRKELEKNIYTSQNKESIETLKNANYKNVAIDAVAETKKRLNKIIAGQVIYYILPPMIFETQVILRSKELNLEKFFIEIKKAGKRVVNYAIKKMGEILKNITGNIISKFVKTFFDIIIEMVKATVKRLVKIIKDLVMSLVNCGKILIDKKATATEKADSISKIISVTITTVVMELLFEYLEKQFGLPDFLMEPLQIIVTILSTNIVMLVLQKLDLFDVQYGLLVSNIEKMFDEENQIYMKESAELYLTDTSMMNQQISFIKVHISEIQQQILQFDVYKDDIMPYLQKLSDIFNMEIDFLQEWNEFVSSV